MSGLSWCKGNGSVFDYLLFPGGLLSVPLDQSDKARSADSANVGLPQVRALSGSLNLITNAYPLVVYYQLL